MAEPIRSSGGNVELGQEIDALKSIAPRRAGSEAERRAARHLQKRLEEMGRDVWTEPTRIRPAFAPTHLIHALVGIVGSVLAVYQPLLGAVIVMLAMVSTLGDFTGAFHLVRLLMPVRASQNVVSDDDTGKPGVIVLVAHYDVPRDGMLRDRRLAPVWPRALLWSLVVIFVCCLARVVGIESTILTVIQFIPTVILITLVPPIIDTAIADPVDDEADNAAGVAIALALANKQLEHFDTMLVFTGGSADFGLGMGPWLKKHRGDLEPEVTAVISLDNFASDEPRYAEKEGPVIASRLHPTLDDLASESGTPFTSRELSDAYLARSAGLPTIRVSGGGEAFVSELLDRIDSEIGPRIA